jgi:beta-N-acetylhexosaminidase
VKHLAAVAVAVATMTASAVAGPAPTAAARHGPDPPFAAPALAIQRLTDAQLAGRRVICSYPGLTPPRSLLRAITTCASQE